MTLQINSNDGKVDKQIQQPRGGRGRSEGQATLVEPSKAHVEKWTGCTPEELAMHLLTWTDVHHIGHKKVLMPDLVHPYTALILQQNNCEEVPDGNAR